MNGRRDALGILSSTGPSRSPPRALIVPEPFFVHSDLTTGVFLADLTAYILGCGWRLQKMTEPVRAELQPYAAKLHDMQFHGEKPKPDGSGVWQLHGITFIDDLRGQADRDADGP